MKEKMRLGTKLLLGLCIILFTCSVQAGDLLEYRFDQGDSHVYYQSFRINSNIAAGGLVMATYLHVLSDFTQTVQGADQEEISYSIILNNALVEEFTRNMSVAGDEQNPIEMNVKSDLQKQVEMLFGQELGQYRVSPSGVTLSEEIRETVKHVKDVDFAALGRQLVFSVPEINIDKGYAWTEVQEFTLPQIGPGETLESEVRYVFLGTEVIDGHECFKVEATVLVDEQVSLEDQDQNSVVEVLHIGVSNLYISSELGILILSETRQDLSVMVYISSENASDVISAMRTEMETIISFQGSL